MQVDGGTFSWAIPKGLIGLNKVDETAHIAVETTIHPISYTTYEGARVYSRQTSLLGSHSFTS